MGETSPDRVLGRIKHLLSSRDITLNLLINIMHKTLAIKKLLKEPRGTDALRRALSDKAVCNIFYQVSSRTHVSSSVAAAKLLGAYVFEIVGSKIDGEYQLAYSSLYEKGASLLDELALTYGSYFDLLNIRAPRVGMVEEVARKLDDIGYNVSVINAGTGEKGEGEHPTQAVDDVYTFFGGFEIDIARDWQKLPDYSIAFINDGRARVVRSNALLMGKLLRMELKFISHPDLEPPRDLLDELERDGVKFSIHHELQPASAAYVLRVPEDWIGKEKTEEIRKSGMHFSLTRFVADKFGYQGVMHPFPRSEKGNELPSYEAVGDESLDTDLYRAWYKKQILNGPPVRAAVMLTLLDPTLDILTLKQQTLDASFTGQCGHCGRLYSSVAGWGALKVERYRRLPLLPLCRWCLEEKK